MIIDSPSHEIYSNNTIIKKNLIIRREKQLSHHYIEMLSNFPFVSQARTLRLRTYLFVFIHQLPPWMTMDIQIVEIPRDIVFDV